ncbi:MAG TPA: lamin tail domain-containing protein [Frankiaceae bacterium]|nr:lamin tail domain-containing protein [Frankiaceae bacterium]
MRRVLLVVLVTLGGVLVGGPAEAAGPLQIVWVNYDPAGQDDGTNASVNKEYVTIKNTATSTTRCLTGWKVRDVRGNMYTFGRFCLAAGKSVHLHTGVGADSATRRFWGRDWHLWDNAGDTAYLRNASGTLMDSCRWGNGIGYIRC